MERVYRWLCAALVCISLAGCSSATASAGREATAEELEGSQWQLVVVAGRAVPSLPGGRQPHITLEAASRQAVGFAGCNNFFGGYLLKGEELTFGLLGSTQMACPEQESDLEFDFFRALEASRRWQIEKGVLLFLDESGSVVARFAR